MFVCLCMVHQWTQQGHLFAWHVVPVCAGDGNFSANLDFILCQLGRRWDWHRNFQPLYVHANGTYRLMKFMFSPFEWTQRSWCIRGNYLSWQCSIIYRLMGTIKCQIYYFYDICCHQDRFIDGAPIHQMTMCELVPNSLLMICNQCHLCIWLFAWDRTVLYNIGLGHDEWK